MTNEYEWIDNLDNLRPEYGAADMLVGWIIYSVVVVFLIV